LDIRSRLIEAITPRTLFTVNLLGFEIPVSDTVVLMWIVMGILIVLSLLLTRKMQTIPSGSQNLVETVVSFINSFTEKFTGHNWKLFAPYIGTVALFLILSNIFSIFNIIPDWEWLYEITHIGFLKQLPHIEIKPPTKDINVTAALGVMSMAAVAGGGIRVKKVSGWLKSFAQPNPIILPFKILDYLIRPTSLCLRLFGNILGAYIIMELLYISIPLILPGALSIYFDLFDGAIQAYVFVFLTTFYIAEAVE
jgi:F-type H+-transporting ATPase subunit a